MEATRIIDLDTPAGIAEHLATLPTENIRAIAARPIFGIGTPVSNFLLVSAAGFELILREAAGR